MNNKTRKGNAKFTLNLNFESNVNTHNFDSCYEYKLGRLRALRSDNFTHEGFDSPVKATRMAEGKKSVLSRFYSKIHIRYKFSIVTLQVRNKLLSFFLYLFFI